ncbi:uncharacterized protein G2W53_026614 [Senna tora]|uniref:Uncharacterized protein n=1 Tax=Senna tora TaxID=362788 RepID=A0A834TPE3_9FABA|nr:uncharacterized protein G2W53_026614 [Senna tora]
MAQATPQSSQKRIEAYLCMWGKLLDSHLNPTHMAR